MINLEAKSRNEEIILAYLTENASEVLKEKINNGKKTLSQCWSYIISEAHKLAEKNCAVVEDKEVYGWAVHFFEEDSIEAKEVPVAKAKVVTPAPKPKKVAIDEPEQLSIFDM